MLYRCMLHGGIKEFEPKVFIVNLSAPRGGGRGGEGSYTRNLFDLFFKGIFTTARFSLKKLLKIMIILRKRKNDHNCENIFVLKKNYEISSRS